MTIDLELQVSISFSYGGLGGQFLLWWGGRDFSRRRVPLVWRTVVELHHDTLTTITSTFSTCPEREEKLIELNHCLIDHVNICEMY